MRSSRNQKKGPSGRRDPPSGGFFSTAISRVLFLALPLALASGVAYVAYLDQQVRDMFEGKRWSLPARIYAHPSEIFQGAAFSAQDFEALLKNLKYRVDPRLATQGSFIRTADEIVFRTRDFKFWDKQENSREIRIQFSGKQVQSMEDLNTAKELALLRLEPVQIGSFYPSLKEDRLLIKLDQAPELLLDALFASEDHDFYKHHGVSLKGILRAVWVNVRAGGIVQGGSTITQQLVKNFFLTSKRTWWRKINEIAMSLILDARYPKEEILEAYLNEIYLGQDGARAIHGFGLASQFYFSRTVDELELHHIALLVTMVRGPSYYDPYKFPDRARKRRDLILQEMSDQGYIKPQQATAAAARPLDIALNPHQSMSRYPAFAELVHRQLQQEYRPEDLTSEGLRIFTTLDVEVQRRLELAMVNTLNKLDGRKRNGKPLEGAAIFTRRATGEIAALLGGRDPESSGFNRALDAERQIGSLYKPVVYLTALENPERYTVATLLQDTPVHLKNVGGSGGWNPKNYDNREHGSVPLHRALAHSYNLATVHLGLELGVAHTAKTLRQLGVERKVEMVPSLLLGTASLSPLEVTQMYQTFASDGYLTPLRAIQAVVSQDGRTLQRNGLKVRRSLDPAAVFLVNTVLAEVMREGTAKPAYAILPPNLAAAGKTGTTNDLRDSWFAGFTGDYLGVVWVGRDDNQPAQLTGAQGALRVWATAMRDISQEPLELDPPEDVEWIWVDRASGGRTDRNCPSAIPLAFIRGSAPAAASGCGGSRTVPSGGEGGSLIRELF